MHERSDTVSPFAFFPREKIRTREEMLAEMRAPCGRFTLPETTEESLRAYIGGALRMSDVAASSPIYLGSGMPLNWSRLLQRLHEHGVISQRRFSGLNTPHDRPKILNTQLPLNISSDFSDGRPVEVSAFGAAFSIETAMSKTVGEALERTLLSRYRLSDTQKATPRQLLRRKKHALNLGHLNGFLPFQQKLFPRLSLHEDDDVHWVEGREFSSGKKILLPAQLVFWNYDYEAAQERIINFATTSGSAGHFSRDEAVLSSVLELIQRDGFLMYWLNGIAPRKLAADGCDDPEVQELLATCARYKLETIFLNTTTDTGIPSIACVVIDRASKEPVVSVGGASGFDMRDMLIQSALEAIVVNAYTARNPTFVLPAQYRPFSDRSIVREERLSMWKGSAMIERLGFFLSGKPQSIDECMRTVAGIDTIAAQLRYVTEQLATLGDGYGMYVYDVRDSLLKELGYHVVRTIVPQLVPLYLVESGAPLDSKRLREVPEKLGYTAASEYTPWPHPFP